MSGALAVGAVVSGRYQLRAVVGQAPVYTEYRAHDREVEVEVALWWFRDGVFAGEGVERAIAAGAELRAVNHPSLRKLFAVGRDGDAVYATAQLASGPGFAMRPGAGADAAALLAWVQAVTAGLAAAHERGLVHGRLAPTDVIRAGERIKIGGIGVLAEAAPSALGLWRNVAHHLAPEVRGGGRATAAADVYSLAILVAELATGLQGLAGSEDALLRRVASRSAPLHRLLAAAMSSAAERRPTLAAFGAGLAGALVGETPSPPSAATPTPAGPAQAAEAPSPSQGDASGSRDEDTTHRVPRAPVLAAPAGPAAQAMLAAAMRAAPGGGGEAFDANATVQGRPGPEPEPRRPPRSGVRDRAVRPTDRGRPELASVIAPRADEALPAPPVRSPDVARPVRRPDGVSPVRPPDDSPPGAAAPAAVRESDEPGTGRRASFAPDAALQVVSMKTPALPGAVPAQPRAGTTGERARFQPRLKALSEVTPRTFSTAPGGMGYYAPPKAVSDARRAHRAGRIRIALAVVVIAAIAGGIVAAIVLGGG